MDGLGIYVQGQHRLFEFQHEGEKLPTDGQGIWLFISFDRMS